MEAKKLGEAAIAPDGAAVDSDAAEISSERAAIWIDGDAIGHACCPLQGTVTFGELAVTA